MRAAGRRADRRDREAHVASTTACSARRSPRSTRSRWPPSCRPRSPRPHADSVDAIAGLADVMVRARRAVAAREVSPADARRLIDIAITSAAADPGARQRVAPRDQGQTAKQHLRVLAALTDAAYGAGLLTERERAEAARACSPRCSAPAPCRRPTSPPACVAVERVVEWAQQSANARLRGGLGAVDVPPAPGERHRRRHTARLAAAALRRGHPSPRRLRGGRDADAPRSLRHGRRRATCARSTRASPSASCAWRRPKTRYSRDEIVALPETPADLEPAAGILTQGEGNVLSHVQLLARALGIPNVVLGLGGLQEDQAARRQEGVLPRHAAAVASSSRRSRR